MTIKHTFKSNIDSTGYGYYGFIDRDTNELVIVESWPHEGGEIYRGTFDNAYGTLRIIEDKAPRLYNDIIKYYTERAEPNQKLKIKYLNFGNEFILNDKKYMLINMNVSSYFISTAGKENAIACALDLKDFKVYCFDKETEVKISEVNK